MSTKNAGSSFLSVGIQGTNAEDVQSVSVNAIGDDQHIVKYMIKRAGYYIIFVRWGDTNIVDSPFICKVLF